MANTEIPNNNPNKEPISDKSITKEKNTEISRGNNTSNSKKIKQKTQKNKKNKKN